jgi:hypothetical protein
VSAIAPLLAKGIAKKIDRLARGAHLFHRYAHHPLCGEYAGEVFKVGRRARLCRGCTLVAAGAAVGIAFGVASSAPEWLAALGIPFALALSVPRAGKLATRFAPGALLGLALGSGFASAAAALAAAALAVVLYRRRQPDRSPCATCSERLQASPCRGLAPIVRRERAFQRRISAWLPAP